MFLKNVGLFEEIKRKKRKEIRCYLEMKTMCCLIIFAFAIWILITRYDRLVLMINVNHTMYVKIHLKVEVDRMISEIQQDGN